MVILEQAYDVVRHRHTQLCIPSERMLFISLDISMLINRHEGERQFWYSGVQQKMYMFFRFI
jgi:hypothetical protein